MLQIRPTGLFLKWIQNKIINGPARNLQKNSNFPTGSAPSLVKKYFRVKKSHNEEDGAPRHPQPRFGEVPPLQNHAT